MVGAYEAFSKGVINLRAETYESLDRAVMLFEQAVDLTPAMRARTWSWGSRTRPRPITWPEASCAYTR